MSRSDPELHKMRSLREEDFTSDYVLPMLKARYRGVYYTHSKDEYGRDVLFWTIDEMGDRKDRAVQVKVGNITGSTKQVQEIISQAKAAFTNPIIDESNIKRNICELYVITSGKISDRAKRQIYNGLEHPYRSVISFWNGERVLQEIREIDREFVMEYSQWERLMSKIGLHELLQDSSFKDNLNNNLLPVLVSDYGMSPLQIVDGLCVMLEGLNEVKSRLRALVFPRQRRELLLWLSWLIVAKAYYNLGAGRKFVFK